jgi:hypothetical protein
VLQLPVGTIVGDSVGSCDGTGVYRTSAEEDHPKVNERSEEGNVADCDIPPTVAVMVAP